MKMRKIIAAMAAVLMLLSILPMAVFAAEETKTMVASAIGIGNGVDFTSWNDGPVTITAAKDSGSSTPKYYSTGTALRIYGGNTMTISVEDGYVLKSVVITTATGNYLMSSSNTSVTGATAAYSSATVTLTPSANEITVKRTGTSGHWRVQKVAVTYEAAAGACEHDWVSEQTKAPDCTNAGENTLTCSKCGESKTETVNALGHSYGEATETMAPNCTTAGEKQSTCSACGDVKKEPVKALGHNYVNGVCDVCGAEKPAGYAPITSADQFVSGQYVLVVETGYAPTYFLDDGDKDWVLTGKPEIADGVIDDATGYLWTLTVDGNSVTITDVNGVSIAPKSGNNNGIQSGDYKWTWSFADDKFIFSGTGSDTTYFASNTTTNSGDNKFRAYKHGTCTGNSGASYKYKFTLYAAAPSQPECAHEYDNACDVDCNLCYETREVSHNVIHVAAKAATCTATGNIEYWYCDVCGMAWLDEACTMNTNLRAVNLPMAEHVYFDDCSAICEVCGYEREAGHNVIHVAAKAATCTATGNIEYWYCDVCGMAWLDEACTLNTNLRAVNLPMAEHTYADEFDTDCNSCGAVREIELEIFISEAGTSASEDVRGVAALFNIKVDGMEVAKTTAIYDNATVNGYKLISMGAIASNGVSEKDIPVEYLCDLEDDSAAFAIRVINIPEGKEDVTITFAPYFVVEIDGVATTIYGEAQSASYAEKIS